MDQKLQILREGETHGVDLTCRKHQIPRSLYYALKNKFNNQSPDGLAPKYQRNGQIQYLPDVLPGKLLNTFAFIPKLKIYNIFTIGIVWCNLKEPRGKKDVELKIIHILGKKKADLCEDFEGSIYFGYMFLKTPRYFYLKGLFRFNIHISINNA